MNVQVIAIGVSLTERLRLSIERQVGSALHRFAARLRRVIVRLDDLNGPRGGVDKRCRVEAVLKDGRHLFAEHREAKWLAAAARCVERIGHTVRRGVDRDHDHGQGRMPA